MVAPDAISEASFARLAEEAERLVLVSEEEARRLAVNSVAVDGTVIMRAGDPELAADLRGIGKDAVELEFTEEPLVGECIECHTLHLYD